MITLEDTGKKFIIKDDGIEVLRLGYRIKPQKKQVIFNRLDGDARRFRNGKNRILELLRQKEVTKAYVSVPISKNSDYYLRCFVDCGFEPETKQPSCFTGPNGGIRDGVDLVYYISEERKATATELDSIDTMLTNVARRYSQKTVSMEDLEKITIADGYKIRYANIKDSEGIYKLGKDVFKANDDNTFESVDSVSDSINDEDTMIVVCEKGNEIVGVVSAYIDNPDDPNTRIGKWKTRMCEIADLVVNEEHRNKCIGKAMVARLSYDVITEHNQVPYGYCYYNKEGGKEWGLEAQYLFASLGFKHFGPAHKVNNIAVKDEENTGFKNNVVWIYPIN